MRPPLLFAALSAVLLSACYSTGDGQAPPLNNLYFPTGLALDVLPNEVMDPSMEPPPPPAAKHLYVASSDFDLQYKASALVSYDLAHLAGDPGQVGMHGFVPLSCNTDADCQNAERDRGHCDTDSPDPSYFCVNAALPNPCASISADPADARVRTPADQLLYPGRCASIDPIKSRFIADSVQIGAFATDAIFRVTPTTGPTPGDPSYPGRLFLPVRGDATLHWIDVDGAGGLHCGRENTSDKSCDNAHRVGDDDAIESTNNLGQEPEPFAIAIDDGGDNIVVTNQTTGSISLYANHWEPGRAPQLVSLLTGLPPAPVGVTALPKPFDPNYEPGFLVVYRDAPQVDLLRVHAETSNPGYNVQVLTRAASVAINANSIGSDSRGIVIDDEQRRADYRACAKPCGGIMDKPAQAVCIQQLAPSCFQAAHQANVYVSNRAPASLLIGALTSDVSYASGSSELPAFTDSVPLTVGPSRVVLGKVKVPLERSLHPDEIPLSDDRGPYALEQRVFVVCFDSRRIYIYDPQRHVIDSIVATGRGPFALAIDEARGLGYVAHFTDSYLGVISLDQRFPKNYAAIVASVGVPSPPRASK